MEKIKKLQAENSALVQIAERRAGNDGGAYVSSRMPLWTAQIMANAIIAVAFAIIEGLSQIAEAIQHRR